MSRCGTSLTPRLSYVVCPSSQGLHKMAYWEWGDPDNPRILLCVHGLSRTGRDFDALAQALSTHYRVICPDIVGRGASGHLRYSKGYVIAQYVADVFCLLARLQPTHIDWIGTSMGGLIGLSVAGALATSGWPLALGKMVLNDVGPQVELAGLKRIAQYIDQPLFFQHYHEVIEAVKVRWADFGEHTTEQWSHLAAHVFKKTNRGWELAYDLGIATSFLEQLATLEDPSAQQVVARSQAYLWQAYQSLPSDVLIVRGQESDLLSKDIAQKMLTAHPFAQLYEIAHVGHAPTLMQPEQIERITQFLVKD